jgi:hypothetical protein
MVKKILLGVGLILVGFFGYVATRPSDYVISREITINAPADVIFPYVNDSKKMDSWNPWSELDPDAKMTFTGPDAGVGATTSWEAGKKLGTGSCTIVESVPFTLVKSKLAYTKPRVMTQDAEISLRKEGNQTVVRWSVSGKNDFLSRAVCVFMNMDKMVGGIFENGLSKLKATVESKPALA